MSRGQCAKGFENVQDRHVEERYRIQKQETKGEPVSLSAMWEEVSGEQVEFDGLLIDTLLARGPQKADIATLGGDEIRACVK